MLTERVGKGSYIEILHCGVYVEKYFYYTPVLFKMA